MIPEILVAVASAALIAVLAWIVRKLSHVGRQIDRFRDDWYGDPPRPGYKGRAGFPERLAAVEDRMGAMEGTMAAIQYNVTHHPNSSHDEIINILEDIARKVNHNEFRNS